MGSNINSYRNRIATAIVTSVGIATAASITK
jgi:hypothetical protein